MTTPTLTLCVLCKSEIFALTSNSISSLGQSGKFNNICNIQLNLCVGSSDLPKARSSELTHWYSAAKPNDIFMFVDADQIFVADDILRSLQLLKNHHVVCGAYVRKDGSMTLEPKEVFSFRDNKEGELHFGATGMMMIRYDIVDTIVKNIGPPTLSAKGKRIYPFFYERIVDEKGAFNDNVWLGEDYSFCWLVRNYGGSVYGYISPTVGHIIPMERFIVLPTDKKWNDNSVVYYCGETNEPWSAKNLTTGIGGSELAVIQLSRYWAEKGYDITVFCNCNDPGIYDGVTYRKVSEFNFSDRFNILIAWRTPLMLDYYAISAKKCFLDLHDIIDPQHITKAVVDTVTKICVKSQFHRNMIPDVPDDKIVVIPNGGAVQDEKADIKRDNNYLIYTSSYDRGLVYMLKWGWPLIKQACPDAYMKIYYGWQGFDMTNNSSDSKLFKHIMYKLFEQDGIEECGRVSNDVLNDERRRANIHYYMGNFQEIDCISVRESASVGAIPVVPKQVHVFDEKPYCITIDGELQDKQTHIRAAERIISLIQNSEEAEKIRQNMTRLENETWQAVSESWIKLFN